MGTATALNPTLIISLRRYLNVVGQHLPIKEAFLFGSYARGEATEDSDIDVAIISPAFTGSWIEDSHRLGVLTWGIDTRIEPVGYRPEDFNDDHLLPNEILRTGIKIYPEDGAQ
jgi:uncharacterized protein